MKAQNWYIASIPIGNSKVIKRRVRLYVEKERGGKVHTQLGVFDKGDVIFR